MQVLVGEEGIGEEDVPQRYGAVMAALHNGPWTRKGKKPWTPADFVKPAWLQAEEAPKLKRVRSKPTKPQTLADIRKAAEQAGMRS